jgi:hypothetical protein
MYRIGTFLSSVDNSTFYLSEHIHLLCRNQFRGLLCIILWLTTTVFVKTLLKLRSTVCVPVSNETFFQNLFFENVFYACYPVF